MYIHYTLGAIFIVFILCVHCDNADFNNEILKINVPSAPQNLTANRVSADEIHLLWTPPAGYTTVRLRPNYTETLVDKQKSKAEPDLRVIPKTEKETQADEPISDVIRGDRLTIDAPSNERLKDVDYTYNLYKNEKQNYNEDFTDSDIMADTFPRNKRDVRSYRHRKRRQDNISDARLHQERNVGEETHQAFELPIEVVKKSMNVAPPREDVTQIAYVLYYEEGVTIKKAPSGLSMVSRVPTSYEIKTRNVFRSDLGMQDYWSATKNLTLLNKSRLSKTTVVGFTLRNLKPFTPYKIWVRAFYNFPLGGLMSSDLLEYLGPQSDPLYVLTDVRPPSAPLILNLTCDQPNGLLYLQWRQPLEYNNSLDLYVVTLRKIPEEQPRTTLKLPTNRDEIETTISLKVELWNVTRYEVKVYAVTHSVAHPKMIINGSESPPEEVSSELCAVHPEAMSPGDVSQLKRSGNSFVALLAAALLTVLATVSAALVYWRCRSRVSKCISAAYNYLEEGGERAARAPLNTYKKPVVNCSPLVSCAAGGAGAGAGAEASAGRPPRMAGAAHPLVRARCFPAHVAGLHADGDIGFSKEYEIVVAKSAALGHTSHHSYRPENRLKNRYLNITAYDHSRVCVSAGGRCGAAGCVGGGGGAGGAGGAACDYVNANFIDGMLPALTTRAARRIERRLERRARPNRQPSVRVTKPPPNLAEGIESAFLNIEFSGIVESEDQAEDSDSERSDDDFELDDVYVEINDVPRQIKLEWALWRRRYIATQGPTPATLDAFWRMIWQHRVHTLVMITNLVERGRRKCDMYWPAGGRGSSAEFGGVHVTLLYEDVRAAYTVRHLRARPTAQMGSEPCSTSSSSNSSSNGSGGGSSSDWRHVVQYHYTVWPDHGTPRHPLAVLPFVRAAADPGTVLVHCSAGVGRTGTYIVIDAQLNQLKLTGTLSPLGFLCRARTQRNHLVQTEEQYVFVHDALLEYVRSGNTEVEFTKARQYLTKLLEPISDEELAVMDVNPPKQRSINDLTNGLDNDVTSFQSNDCSDQIAENGSQVSIKTVDMNSDMEKSENQEKDGLVNGDDMEGVYDLAPRSTDTYSKKMQAYNNLNEQEKEEIRRVNRAENYALLERMRSLSNRHQSYQGPPPVNLLEKQYQLITRSCVEPSVCARAPHNADKNRPGGILPSDSARVMLVPKPGVEGSEYVNASWVCGRRRLREYAVAQHPCPAPSPCASPSPATAPAPAPAPAPAYAPASAAGAELWRLLWDHTAQLVLTLTDTREPDCGVFWPTEDEKELFVANFRASFVSKDIYIAYRKSERKISNETPPEPEINGYRRQEGSECADDERLIPENGSPVINSEQSFRFDRTELRLERLSGSRDLSARKSIANGDLFSSFSEKKNGPKSPRSPSKMSLKNFKLSSPTKFKFPEWGSRTAGSPPDTAPPPPPIAPSLSVEEETELRRPVYTFEKVQTVPNVPTDRIIEVTNVSVHSLQDDYQLSVKFIKCSDWLNGDTCDYDIGEPEDNEFIRAVRQAASDSEREQAIDRLIAPYQDSFALIEFVAGCQMEYKNGPVVVVDKYGGWRALTFCSLSAACGGVRNPDICEPGAEYAPPCTAADLYCSSALNAHTRCSPLPQLPHLPRLPAAEQESRAHSPQALLSAYCALTAYAMKLPRPDS